VDVQSEVSEVITAPNAGLNVGSNGIRLWVVYPMIAATLFLILVAALYHWLRQGENTLIPASPELTTPAPALAPAQTPPPAADASVITPLTLPDTPPPANPPPESATAAPANNMPATMVAPSVAKPAAPEAIAAPANGAGGVTAGPRSMRFEPAQDAWIQVVDAKGSRFSKLVRAGSVESFSGEPPFRLVVGEAALVKLTYNGHGIDLTPFIGQKVARLTLE
jgi:cytoskeleton protein RodZ